MSHRGLQLFALPALAVLLFAGMAAAAAIRAVRPELDIAGTLSGMVSARGSAEAPVIEFELSGSGIRAP